MRSPVPVLLLLAATQPGQPLAAQTWTGYPLACRGPLTVVLHQTPGDTAGHHFGLAANRLIIAFAMAPSAAGPRGDGLPPGSCAWIDRPTNKEEGRELWLDFSLGFGVQGGAGITSLSAETMVFECTASPSCVTVMYAGAASPGVEPETGVSIEGTAPERPGQVPLYSFITPFGPPPDLVFIRLDGGVRPNLSNLMTSTPTVRVREAP